MKRVTNASGWHSYQCSRKAIEDGYCFQHSESYASAKAKRRNKKWALQDAVQKAQDAVDKAEATLLSYVMKQDSPLHRPEIVRLRNVILDRRKKVLAAEIELRDFYNKATK